MVRDSRDDSRRNQLQKILKSVGGFLGSLLSLAGLWYLLDYIERIDLASQLAILDGTRILAISGLTTILAAANGLVALSWRTILADFGGDISSVHAQLLFSWTNLLKYVPGNIVHVAGRQILTMRAGVPGWAVAKSLTMEIILLVLSSLTFAGIVWLLPQIVGMNGVYLSLALLLAAASSVLFLQWMGLRGSAWASLGYWAYHLIGGIVFALLFVVLGAGIDHFRIFWFLIIAYVASWVLGMLTPGSPAGLGVREATLIGLLQHSVQDQAMLGAAVLLSRGMSVFADITYFLVLRCWSFCNQHTD